MSKNWSHGSTYAWRRVRAEILLINQAENNGKCRLAIPDVCTGTANTVHHTLGREVTGDDPRYLIAVCAACNTKVGSPSKHKEQPSTINTDWI